MTFDIASKAASPPDLTWAKRRDADEPDEPEEREDAGEERVVERGERDMLKMPDMMLLMGRPLATSASGVEWAAA